MLTRSRSSLVLAVAMLCAIPAAQASQTQPDPTPRAARVVDVRPIAADSAILLNVFDLRIVHAVSIETIALERRITARPVAVIQASGYHVASMRFDVLGSERSRSRHNSSMRLHAANVTNDATVRARNRLRGSQRHAPTSETRSS